MFMFKKNFANVIKKNLLNNCESYYQYDLRRKMQTWRWDMIAQDILENRQFPGSWDDAKITTFEIKAWIEGKQVIALIYWDEILKKTDFLKYLKDC